MSGLRFVSHRQQLLELPRHDATGAYTKGSAPKVPGPLLSLPPNHCSFTCCQRVHKLPESHTGNEKRAEGQKIQPKRLADPGRICAGIRKETSNHRMEEFHQDESAQNDNHPHTGFTDHSI
jgi:hypothetical protein